MITLNWYGWLLVYLSNTSFSHLSNRQDTFNPFKCKHCIIHHITGKLDYVPQDSEINDVFSDLEKVLCIIPEYDVEENTVDVVEEDIDVNLHEVIIINPILFTDGYHI